MQKQMYADLTETVSRPIIETVGSALGGAYAYNELVAKDFETRSPPFNQKRLREKLFAEGDQVSMETKFDMLKNYLAAMSRDANKRLGAMASTVSLDVWNVVELAVEKIIDGDQSAIALCEQFVARDERRRNVYAVLIVAAAAKTLDLEIKDVVATLALLTFDEATSKDKKGRRARRKHVAQLSGAADLVKKIYCPLTNFCSLAIWLRETIENNSTGLDPLNLYTEYEQRERELIYSQAANAGADDDDVPEHPQPDSISRLRDSQSSAKSEHLKKSLGDGGRRRDDRKQEQNHAQQLQGGGKHHPASPCTRDKLPIFDGVKARASSEDSSTDASSIDSEIQSRPDDMLQSQLSSGFWGEEYFFNEFVKDEGPIFI